MLGRRGSGSLALSISTRIWEHYSRPEKPSDWQFSIHWITGNPGFQTPLSLNTVDTGTYSRQPHTCQHSLHACHYFVTNLHLFLLRQAISSSFPLRWLMHCPLWLFGSIRSVYKIHPFFLLLLSQLHWPVQHHSPNNAACHCGDPMLVYVGSMADKGSLTIIPSSVRTYLSPQAGTVSTHYASPHLWKQKLLTVYLLWDRCCALHRLPTPDHC
jgi:hypothetical protein